ncbi:MAG: PAS domain S-box protein, partial [candidate division NC10 bacterium]
IRYEDMALEGHDGKRHEVEFVSNVYLVAGKKVIQCNIRDISERVRAWAALRASEDNYRMLFREMQNGFALHEIICDEAGNPSDYRFLAVNPAFERMTGLKAAETVGRTVLEILPDTERSWIEHYGKVALTGVPVCFENYAASMKKHFEVVAFRPKIKQFACVFSDITVRKQAEEQLRQQGETLQANNEELSRLNRLMTGRELRLIEMKQQVNDLAAQLGQPRPHALAFMDAAAAEILRTTPQPRRAGGVISDQ